MASSAPPPIEELPAAYLAGRTLTDGTRIIRRLEIPGGLSGGHFSFGYEVILPSGQTAFLKALNFQAVGAGAGSMIDRMKAFTDAFVFERDLLRECITRDLSRIIRLLGDGEVTVAEATPPLSEVPYLILEKADGDIRTYQMQLDAFDTAWSVRAFKQLLEAVEQLHSSGMAHQDIKPGNILTLADGAQTKLGDLGRADRNGVDGPTSAHVIPGAVSYAPPEQLYRAFGRTWEERRAGDMYLTGSVAVHMFLGHSMTALIIRALEPAHHPGRWTGNYKDVLGYLASAHAIAIRQLADVAVARLLDKALGDSFADAISQMTDPDPERRGHPRDRAANTSSFAVRRYISQMDLLLSRYAVIQTRVRRAEVG